MKQDGGDHSEPRYGAARAAAVALLRPVTAVRRGDHLPMWRAWLVHMAGVLMAAGVLLVLKAWNNVQGTATPTRVAGALLNMLPDFVIEFQSVTAWVELIFAVLFVEFTWGLTALGMMPWCAQDERLRLSYGRALRRLLLLTPHAAMVVMLTGGAIIWIDRISWDYIGIFRTRDVISILLFITGGLWSLGVMLAAMGCRSAPAMCRWPARCEGCGYQLTGIEFDQECPECGRAIIKTLGKYVRPGITPPSGFAGWLGLTYQAVRHPTAFGRKLHVLSPDTGHQRCLAMTVAFMVLASPIAVTGLYFVVESAAIWSNGIDWHEVIAVTLIGSTMLGLMFVAMTMAAALGWAGLIGTIEGRHQERNLMPAAFRAACYQSGFLLFWAGVCWCSLVIQGLVVKNDWLIPITAQSNLDLSMLLRAWQFGVIGLGVVIYMVLIGRATRAARYANW